MKVNELLKLCAEMGNLDFPTEYDLDTQLNTQGSCARRLLNCCNDTIEELFRDYSSSIRKTVVEAVDGFADTSEYKLCKVISLVDGEGNDVKYRYTEGGLQVEKDGRYNLCYAKLPSELTVYDDVVLPSPRITERIVAYGILRDYFTMEGDFASAAQWDERYKDALRTVEVKCSSMRMPVGRWL